MTVRVKTATICLSVLTGLLSVVALECSAEENSKPDGTSPPAQTSNVVDASALDTMLAKNDFNGVTQALARLPARARADWLRDRLIRGGSIFLAFPYITTLWQSGEAEKIADPKVDTRVSAGLILFYAYQVIVIDGVRCGDKSAPANRKMQLLTGFRPVFQHLKSQTADIQKTVIETSSAMEAKIARANDHFLCSGGMSETTAALEESGLGNKTIGDLAKEGQEGRAIALPSAKAYVPQFVAPGAYEQEQTVLRTQLHTALPQFFK